MKLYINNLNLINIFVATARYEEYSHDFALSNSLSFVLAKNIQMFSNVMANYTYLAISLSANDM